MVSKDLISCNLPKMYDGKLRKETGEAWNKADTNAHIRTAPPSLFPGPFCTGKFYLVGSYRVYYACSGVTSR